MIIEVTPNYLIIPLMRTHIFQHLPLQSKHTIFRLDAHYSQPYLCAVTFNNNDYGKRKSKLSGGI